MFALLLCLFSPPALAQSHLQFEWGQRLYELGDYEAAIVEWQAIYDHEGIATVQGPIAHVRRILGDREGEREALELYYTVAPRSELKALASRIAELGGTLPMRDLRQVQRAQTVPEALRPVQPATSAEAPVG